MSILKATHRASDCSVVGVQVGIAAVEVEAARIGTANRNAPIPGVRPDIAERTTAAEAVARHRQF